MDASISLELIAFIRRVWPWSAAMEISVSTGMQRDLGIYGDDAMEFLVMYSDTFHVDINDFPSSYYFDGERPDVMGFLLGLFQPAKPPRKELTVGHLQRGIQAKRLDEQVIQGA